jgi:hypothetical protein
VSGVDFDIREVLVVVRILQDVVLGVGEVSGVGHFGWGVVSMVTADPFVAVEALAGKGSHVAARGKCSA